MSVQIKNILIWQKSGVVRNLELKRNAVNVITGESGKGKSSILHIIDYCLLSSKANGISKANIDDKSSWYGLRLYTSKGLVTIARAAYHVGEMSTAYFSDNGEIPDFPTHNMKVASLKKVLDKEFGLDSDLKIPYGGKTIKAGSKVSFRNFLSFCYQDQNAIVAPDYLYNNPSDIKVAERIERTFRMALGIVDAKGAIVSERLDKLKSDRLSIERRSELIGKKRLEFQEDVVSLEEEAISLGLLEKASDDIQSSLDVLEKIANSPIERFSDIGEKVKVLELRELELNRKLRKFKSFNEGYREYQSIIKESDDSIRPVLYLIDSYREILPGTKTNEVLQALENELKSAKQSWKKRNDSLLHVDISDQTKVLEAELNDLRIEIGELRGLSERLSSPKEIYRYQGKLGVKVELYSDKAIPLDYSERLSEIDAKIAHLDGIVQDMDSKREFVIGKLNEKINEHLNRLKLKGYEASRAIFLEREQAINLILDEGRSVEKMIDIGSASNYLYIHLSYFMALHEVARGNHVPWMPHFLVFDQVSTPYAVENSDDISSLDLALRELNIFVESMKDKGGIQVILMEHIPESHWTNLKLENFKLVDKELIDGYGLIN
jgi:energy-coupling factor transporter ATP-binding protein EcfA2